MKLHKSKEAVICALLGLRNIGLCGVFTAFVGVVLMYAMVSLDLALNVNISFAVISIAFFLLVTVPIIWLIDVNYKKRREEYSLAPLALWVSYALFPAIVIFTISYSRIEYSDLSNGDKIFLSCISPLWIFPVFAAIKELFGLYKDKAETDKWENAWQTRMTTDRGINMDKPTRCLSLPIIHTQKTEWLSFGDEDGVITISYPRYSDEVREWIDKFYSLDIADNNYTANMKKIQSKPINTLTTDQTLTRLTAIVRGEKFCEGNIAEALESGELEELCRHLHETAQKQEG